MPVTRSRVLRAAIASTIAATLLAPAAIACILACVPLLLTSRPEQVRFALLATTIVTSFGVGFVLDDPAAVTLESSPTSLPSRRGLRLGLLAAVLGLGTILQLAVAVHEARGSHLPIGAWLVEDAAFVIVTLAVAAFAQRVLPERAGGAAAAPTGLVLLVVVGALMQLGPWLTAVPGGPQSERWWLVVAAAFAVLARLSRDQGAPRLRDHPWLLSSGGEPVRFPDATGRS